MIRAMFALRDVETRYRRIAEQKELDEVRRCASMTPQEKWDELRALCSDGLRLVRALGREAEVGAYRDPVPESTRALLATLRAKSRARPAA